MGWLFHSEKLRHETPVQCITREFSHQSETAKATVLAAAAVRGKMYPAIRTENKTTGKTLRVLRGHPVQEFRTVRLRLQGHGRKLRPMRGRLPGPHPTAAVSGRGNSRPGYAAALRARVATRTAERFATLHKTAALSPGDIIRLPHAVSFRNAGITTNRFRFLSHYKRTPVFEPVDRPSLRCRLRRETLAAATIER